MKPPVKVSFVLVLSVIIVNWNTREHLEKCLNSIQAHAPQFPFEVIVVENDSADLSAEMVTEKFPNVKLIQPGFNTGYADGNNRGFAVATGDFLLTLNPDTEFVDDTLEQAVLILASDPNYGSLCIKLIGPDGRTQRSIRGFPTLAGIAGQILGLDRIFPRSAWASYSLPSFDYDVAGDAPQPMGTFVLFRRQALASVGDPTAPFDQQFPIYFNDVDLSFRLTSAGFKCLFAPRLRVRHHHGASTNQRRKSMIWESHLSLLRYFRKHGGWAIKLAYPGIVFVVTLAALLRAKGYDAGFRPLHNNL